MRPSRFQFSLRTLFLVVTLLAIPCWYVGDQWRIVQHRARIKARILFLTKDDREALQKPDEVSWVRRWPGDEAISHIAMSKGDEPQFIEEVKENFPEAVIFPYTEEH